MQRLSVDNQIASLAQLQDAIDGILSAVVLEILSLAKHHL
jgi:hypothetical protein